MSEVTGAFEASTGEYSLTAYIYVWAPALSALAVIVLTQGPAGLRAYARRLIQWPRSWTWHAAVLVGIPLVWLVAAALAEALGQEALRAPEVSPGAFLSTALLVGTQGPVEELGWPGYALALLQRRLSRMKAALILGAIWWVWHVPPVVLSVRDVGGGMEGSLVLALLRLLVSLLANSLVMTMVYNGSSGSLPLMFLFHWLTNLRYPWEAFESGLITQDILSGIVALGLVTVFGRRFLGCENLYVDTTLGAPEPSSGLAVRWPIANWRLMR